MSIGALPRRPNPTFSRPRRRRSLHTFLRRRRRHPHLLLRRHQVLQVTAHQSQRILLRMSLMIQVRTGAVFAEVQKVKLLPTSFSWFNEDIDLAPVWRVSSTGQLVIL